MSLNRFKHILLGFLILLSLFLSFIIWIPTTTVTEDPDVQTDNVVPGSLVDRNIHDVYAPVNYVYHNGTSTAYDSNVFNGAYSNLIDTMELDELRPGEEVSVATYQANIVNNRQIVEFVFADLMPFGIFEEHFNNMPPDLADTQFDRFSISLDNQSTVYFYNSRNSTLSEVQVDNIQLDEIKQKLTEENALFPVYLQSLESTYVYLPSENIELKPSHYIVERLPNNLYSSYFFPVPSGVELRVTNNISRFIDLTTELRINNETNVLTYYRQLSDLNELTRTERFLSSVNELTTLENWTNQIKFVGTNEHMKHLHYRRFLDGYPIFSQGDLATITEVGVFEEGLAHLRLPLQVVQTPITIDENETKTLASGPTVMNVLSTVIETEQVQDLKIGVQWQDTDESTQVIRFEPRWFIKVVDEWKPLEDFVKERGGSTDGL